MHIRILSSKHLLAATLLAIIGLIVTPTPTQASVPHVVAKCNNDNGATWYDWRPTYTTFTVYFKGFESAFGGLTITKREWNYGDGTGWHTVGAGGTGSCVYYVYGAKTATYRVTADGNTYTDTCSVTVFYVTPDYDLWYFNGEDALNYHEQVTWTANGATTGTFKWDVIAGTAKVNLENDTDSITKTNNNQVGIKSTAASATERDFTIRFTYNSVAVADTSSQVLAPVAYVNSINYGDWGPGFDTTYVMRVEDKVFHDNLPASLEVNEQFGAWQSDYAGHNWGAPTECYWWTYPLGPEQCWDDNYYFQDQNATPTPVNHNDPNAGVKVMHAPQYYRGGSLAICSRYQVKSHKWSIMEHMGRRGGCRSRVRATPPSRGGRQGCEL